MLLANDEAVLREGLQLLLNCQPGIAVVAEVSDCHEAVAAAKQEQPDIVLLDNNLKAENILSCIREIRRGATCAQVIILTGDDNLEEHFSAISQGAKGLVRKSDTSDVLVNAIKKVYAGEVWLDGALITRLLNEMWLLLRAGQAEAEAVNHIILDAPPQVIEEEEARKNALPDAESAKIASLTGREREIVTLIGEGLKNKEIAGRLFISVITVRHHLSSIYNKLEVSDRFELAIYAFRYGLAKIPLRPANEIPLP